MDKSNEEYANISKYNYNSGCKRVRERKTFNEITMACRQNQEQKTIVLEHAEFGNVGSLLEILLKLSIFIRYKLHTKACILVTSHFFS